MPEAVHCAAPTPSGPALVHRVQMRHYGQPPLFEPHRRGRRHLRQYDCLVRVEKVEWWALVHLVVGRAATEHVQDLRGSFRL